MTRARAQSTELKAMLEQVGAEIVDLPLLNVAPEVNKEITSEVFAGLGSYEWIVFTSINGVREFLGLFFRGFEDLRCLGPARIACVGKATAEEWHHHHLQVDLVPKKATAENLAQALIETESLENSNVLVVTGNRNRDVLVEMLENVGHAIVDVMQVYSTGFNDLEDTPEAERFRQEGADAMVFASSSAVESFVEQQGVLALGKDACKPIHCSIGPATSRALKQHNLEVHLEASQATLTALVEVLSQHFSNLPE